MTRMTRRLRIAFSLLLLGAGALSAQACADDAGMINAASFPTANGEQIYQHICQGCHMPNGGGATGAGTYPSFIKSPAMASSQYLALVLINGRRDMPAFGARGGDPFLRGVSLTDQQIAGVINYVRSHFGNTYTDQISAAEISALHPKP